jgi:dCMP deaminase
MVHAEVNALLNATRSVENCVIYTTFCPCSECTKLIIQSGIAKVVYRKASQELTDRWREKSRRSLGLLEEAGIPAEELP